jgi:hypothetical protein
MQRIPKLLLSVVGRCTIHCWTHTPQNLKYKAKRRNENYKNTVITTFKTDAATNIGCPKSHFTEIILQVPGKH